MSFLKNFKKIGENLKKNLTSLSDTLENSENLKNLKDRFEEKKSQFLDEIDERLNMSENFKNIKETFSSITSNEENINEEEIIVEVPHEDSKTPSGNDSNDISDDFYASITKENSNHNLEDIEKKTEILNILESLKEKFKKDLENNNDLQKSIHENKLRTDIGHLVKEKANSEKKINMVDFEGKNYEIDGESLIVNQNCQSLRKIRDLSRNIKLSIKTLNFSNCEKITLIERIDIDEYKNVEKIILPPNLKSIEERTFCDFKNLKSVKFNEGLESIGERAFMNTAIESIVFPESLKNIDDRAFMDCKNLKSVKFNEGLESIGAVAFSNTDIEFIELPKSLKNIADSASFRTVKYLDFSKCILLSRLRLSHPRNHIIFLGKEMKELNVEYCRGEKLLIFLSPTLQKIELYLSLYFELFCYTKSFKSLKSIVNGGSSNVLYVKKENLQKFRKQAEIEGLESNKLIIKEMPIEYEYFWD